MTNVLTWAGIVFCLSQSALFSGLNLALFSISRLRLEVGVAQGDRRAERILAVRRDANLALVTILWSNVGINVLLTLLSDSVMAGLIAFLFSTVAITLFGEIAPQAYFSRHAQRMASLLIPVLKVYQFILYPIVKPCAMVLNAWLGKEGMQFFAEKEFRGLIAHHMKDHSTDLGRVEGLGALNFLAFDDDPVATAGRPIDPDSVIEVDCGDGRSPIRFEPERDGSLMAAIERSGRKWVVLTGAAGRPQWVLDANAFLREALHHRKGFDLCLFAHRPIVVEDPATTLGSVIQKLTVLTEHKGDEVIDKDVILLWGAQKRIITGADILGRLLRGIVGALPAD